MTAMTPPSEINTRWAEAFNRGDLSVLLEMYEPDAMLVPGPGQPPVSGLEAIESSLRWLIGLGGRINFEPRYWLEHGDLAMGRIDYHIHGGIDGEGNPIELHGGTAEVLRRQADGTWKYVFDHPFAATADQ